MVKHCQNSSEYFIRSSYYFRFFFFFRPYRPPVSSRPRNARRPSEVYDTICTVRGSGRERHGGDGATTRALENDNGFQTGLGGGGNKTERTIRRGECLMGRNAERLPRRGIYRIYRVISSLLRRVVAKTFSALPASKRPPAEI